MYPPAGPLGHWVHAPHICMDTRYKMDVFQTFTLSRPAALCSMQHVYIQIVHPKPRQCMLLGVSTALVAVRTRLRVGWRAELRVGWPLTNTRTSTNFAAGVRINHSCLFAHIAYRCHCRVQGAGCFYAYNFCLIAFYFSYVQAAVHQPCIIRASDLLQTFKMAFGYVFVSQINLAFKLTQTLT